MISSDYKRAQLDHVTWAPVRLSNYWSIELSFSSSKILRGRDLISLLKSSKKSTSTLFKRFSEPHSHKNIVWNWVVWAKLHTLTFFYCFSPTVEDVQNVQIVCVWCQKEGVKRYSLCMGSELKSFCSEKCFAACRRAYFKRNKVSGKGNMYTRHISNHCEQL